MTIRNRLLLGTAACMAIANDQGSAPRLTIKVEGDIAGFKQGQELTTSEEIGAYFRAIYSEADMGSLSHMSNDDIVTIAEGVSSEGMAADEWELEVLSALEAGGDAEEGDAELAESLKAVSDKVSHDATILNWVDQAIEGQIKVDTSPVWIADRFLNLLKPEELALLPWPGSKSGNNPDITTARRIKNDGTVKEVKSSAIKAFIALQPRVVLLRKQQDDIKAKVPEGSKLNAEQNTALKNVGKRITSAARAYNFAIKLSLLFSKLKDHPHLEMEFNTEPKTGPDGKSVEMFVESTYCVDVANKHKRKQFGTFSVSGITRVNPDAITGNTTFEQFVTMLQRKRKPDTPTTKYEMPAGVVEVAELTSVAVHAFETASLWSQVSTAMAFTDGPNKEQADDIILNVGRLEELCADLLKRKGTRTRLAELRRIEAEAGKRAPDKVLETA